MLHHSGCDNMCTTALTYGASKMRMPADCNPLRVLLLHHCAHHLGWGNGTS
jgi:hypothetical protein